MDYCPLDRKDVFIILDISYFTPLARRKMKRFQEEIEEVARRIKTKSADLYDHSLSVADISSALAPTVATQESDQWDAFIAGFLHDIGKLDFSEELLKKRYAEMSEADLLVFREHPITGGKILEAYDNLRAYAPIILYHHEAPGRRGYPLQAKLSDIPLLSRVVHVSNRFSNNCIRRKADGSRDMSPVAALSRMEKDIISFFGRDKFPAVQEILLKMAAAQRTYFEIWKQQPSEIKAIIEKQLSELAES